MGERRKPRGGGRAAFIPRRQYYGCGPLGAQSLRIVPMGGLDHRQRNLPGSKEIRPPESDRPVTLTEPINSIFTP